MPSRSARVVRAWPAIRISKLFGVGLALLVSSWSSAASAGGSGRFFLLVSDHVAEQALIDGALREALKGEQVVSGPTFRRQLEQVYPLLFEGSGVVQPGFIVHELDAARAAHYASHFDQAEAHFARAFDLIYGRPDLVAVGAEVVDRLADGAALRYRNASAAAMEPAIASARLKSFIRRFPGLEPSRAEHPPAVLAAWQSAKRAALERSGSLSVHTEPLELERRGDCVLLANGVQVDRLPMAGPVALPRGEHLVQVRCGPQHGWLQRITLGDSPQNLRVPVRAMLATRAELRAGGLVVTRPAPGDAARLVDAVCEAAGFGGAVTVAATGDEVRIGRWSPEAPSPRWTRQGTRDGARITNTHAWAGDDDGGRVWTWVVGGIGAAALVGGLAANIVYVERSDEPDPGDLSGLKSTSIALYAVGGVLLAAGVVLFFAEQSGDTEGAAHLLSPSGTGLSFTF